MTHHDVTTSKGASQGQTIQVIVDLRRRDNTTSRIKAHADVEVRIDSLGSINVFGFSVFEPEGKPLIVLPPAHKGERKSFPHVKLTGKVKSMIESAILRECQNLSETEKE
ncbi:MAG: hypothetical protein ABIR70_17965 [Bryobacteraceae bacterium]